MATRKQSFSSISTDNQYTKADWDEDVGTLSQRNGNMSIASFGSEDTISIEIPYNKLPSAFMTIFGVAWSDTASPYYLHRLLPIQHPTIPWLWADSSSSTLTSAWGKTSGAGGAKIDCLSTTNPPPQTTNWGRVKMNVRFVETTGRMAGYTSLGSPVNYSELNAETVDDSAFTYSTGFSQGNPEFQRFFGQDSVRPKLELVTAHGLNNTAFTFADTLAVNTASAVLTKAQRNIVIANPTEFAYFSVGSRINGPGIQSGSQITNIVGTDTLTMDSQAEISGTVSVTTGIGPGTGVYGTTFPGSIYARKQTEDFVVKWRCVPEEYVVDTTKQYYQYMPEPYRMLGSLGKVNSVAFCGHPPQTLLFDGVDMQRYQQPIWCVNEDQTDSWGLWAWNFIFHFVKFDPSTPNRTTNTGVPAITTDPVSQTIKRGWYLFPHRDSNGWFTATRGPGRGTYNGIFSAEEIDFADIFKHWAAT